MVEQNLSSADPLYEHEWVAALQELSAKAGDRDIYVEYLFPAGYLFATGFQLRVDERTIHILLQRQAPEGLANALLQLRFPDEETSVYRKRLSMDGEIFVSVAYPYCDHHLLPGVSLAEIRIATNAELLVLVTSAAQKQ